MKTLGPSGRRASIVVLVIGLFVLTTVLRPRVEAIEADAQREELLDDAKARGLNEEQASCFVDGFREAVGSDFDNAGVSDRDGRKTLTLLFQCLGAEAGSDQCLLDAVSEIMNLDGANAVDFVEAEAELDAQDREQLAEAGMQCRGMSADVATCVTDSMKAEFGDDVFESRIGPQVSPDGQRQVAAMSAECATTSSVEDPGAEIAASVCGAYARSLSTAWSAVAPRDFAPVATATAVADALERSAQDAPPELTDDVVAVVEAARANAEEVDQKYGDAATEQAAIAAFRLAGIELDAQLRIWAACPDLDADLGDGGADFAHMVFAIGGSQADMEDELLACIQDPGSVTPGDNAGCDRLADACESGENEACDDIFVWSEEGSVYEEIGASCGGRLKSDDERYGGGACETLSE